MPNPYFAFKKFTVRHDRCAMKVGTDGVLLGAWADVSSSQHVLDIGTGTGLIALMLAQRCPAQITAIDIDPDAVSQATENIAASPWQERVEVKLADVCDFLPGQLFDTIVSNPPYFIDSLKCPDSQRNTARHTDTLDANTLVSKVSQWLHPQGHFSVILPSDQSDKLIETALSHGLYLSRHTAVITRPGLPPKRSLLEFRKSASQPILNEFVIELDRHVYSEEYIGLTRDFYLKF